MRYVLFAAAALAVTATWLNTNDRAARIKRQMTEHPAEPAKLY